LNGKPLCPRLPAEKIFGVATGQGKKSDTQDLKKEKYKTERKHIQHRPVPIGAEVKDVPDPPASIALCVMPVRNQDPH